jgi:hypothetical protein
MAKLIGRDPNQVPSNADLGTAAFLDAKEIITAKGGKFAGVNATYEGESGDTDIFLYDTRLDSDGGEWRKRCQHTSWYNEPLNTEWRGSRREFPVMALIVSTVDDVTIYDADGIDLEMWMKFEAESGGMGRKRMLQYRGYSGYVCAAKNAVIVLGQKTSGDNYGSPVINLISEKVVRHDPQAGSSEGGYWVGNIAQRNSHAAGWVASDYKSLSLDNSIINAVAMTVTPDANIDLDTGLPSPTIAFGTQGGVSLIEDTSKRIFNGGEANSSWNSRALFFDKDHNLWAIEASNYSPGLQLMARYPYNWGQVEAIGTGSSGYQLTSQVVTNYGRNTTWPYILGHINESGSLLHGRILATDKYLTTGYTGGVTLVDDQVDKKRSMVYYITGDSVSGWMPGDIKLSTGGPCVPVRYGSQGNLVTNGTFDSNVNGWVGGTSGATVTYDSGRLRFDASSSNNQRIYTVLSEKLIPGKVYNLTVRQQSTTQKQLRIFVNSVNGISGGQVLQDTSLTNQGTDEKTYHYTFTASAYWNYLVFEINGYGVPNTWYLDEVILREGAYDRSHYGYQDNVANTTDEAFGFSVFGDIECRPVDTGADLCAYSNFSSTNYLRQENNLHLNWGTDQWCFMGWAKGNGTIIHVGVADSNESLRIYTDPTSYGVYVDYGIGAPYSYISDTQHKAIASDGAWHFIVAYAQAGNERPVVYVDGVRYGMTAVGSIPSTFNWTRDYYVGIGVAFSRDATPGNVHNGELTLLRLSKTIPSQAQIEKIYFEEKMLFGVNAKCTLIDNNTYVRGMAFDEMQHLLHVGTSSGRSTFSDLVRVDERSGVSYGGKLVASDGYVIGR